MVSLLSLFYPSLFTDHIAKRMVNMKIRIENGMTIISTGDAVGGTKNKHKQAGVSQQYTSSGIKYRAEIIYKHHKYFLGSFDTSEEAAQRRIEAEKQVKAGTYLEWYDNLYQEKKSKRNMHGATGVSWRFQYGKTKYSATIQVNKKTYHLGTWNTVEEAVAVRQEADRQRANGTFHEWFQERKGK